MVFVRLAAKARAPKLGEYPRRDTAAKTRSRVFSTTLSGEFRHLETVAVETFASLATSSKVGTGRFFTFRSK